MCTRAVDRVVDERLLVRGDRAVDVALRGFGVAEPDVRIRVERAGARSPCRTPRPPDRRAAAAATGRDRRAPCTARDSRIELRRGAELCGRFPSVAERLVHHAEHVGRDDEARVDLDGTRQKIDARPRCPPGRARNAEIWPRENSSNARGSRVGRAAFSIRAHFGIGQWPRGACECTRPARRRSRPNSSPGGRPPARGSRLPVRSA